MEIRVLFEGGRSSGRVRSTSSSGWHAARYGAAGAFLLFWRTVHDQIEDFTAAGSVSGDHGRRAQRSRTAGHRYAGLAKRDHDRQPRAAAGARPEVRRRHQGRRAAVEGLVGAAHRAAQGRAQRAADHHRRRRLRRAEHFRRRHPDTHHGPHRERRSALQPHVLHRAVLADARRADHRAQPPLGRFRRDLRAVDRLPRLQQHHRQGQGDDRPHAGGQRLFHRMVRQGPQHAGLRGQPGRAVRPVAVRHGLRVLLRLRGRRRQPVAAEPVPQHDADLSVPGQAGLEPGHRHGGRRHRVHDADPPDATRQADLHQVCAGRDACPAPPHQGVGGQDPRDAPLRRRLREAARAHLREPEEARRGSEGRPGSRRGRARC